jgi:hypothetical protein
MVKHSSAFIDMMHDAIGGAVAGLIAGLILGVAIKYISLILIQDMIKDGPHILAPFLGMGLGTLVGAILGGQAGMKNA